MTTTASNYDRITTAILAALSGELPSWRRPWRTIREDGGAAVPVNAVTGRAYRGINVLLLWGRNDADKRYLTFKQAQALGGHVRRGEKGTQIVFWSKRTFKHVDANGKEENKSSLLMRLYTVFNVSQCEKLTFPKSRTAPVEKPAPKAVDAMMEDIYGACRAKVIHGGDRACYMVLPDQICMPKPEAFTTDDGYAATALHELTHWTGNASRLNREFGKRFGDQAYAAEELVAELGAAFLCASLGVNSSLEHHASYVASWKKLLTSDAHAVITAASKAQAAADYVLAAVHADKPNSVSDDEEQGDEAGEQEAA